MPPGPAAIAGIAVTQWQMGQMGPMCTAASETNSHPKLNPKPTTQITDVPYVPCVPSHTPPAVRRSKAVATTAKLVGPGIW